MSVTYNWQDWRQRYRASFGSVRAVLGTLVLWGGGGSVRDIAEGSGYSRNTGLSTLRHIRDLGWVIKPHHGWVQLTERGRIAYAILEGRATRQACAQRPKQVA